MTLKHSKHEKDGCPVCVLTEADTHVCDVICILRKIPSGLQMRLEADKQLTEEQQFAIVSLVTTAHRRKIPVGQGCESEDGSYCCYIDRLSRNRYKFCFHVKEEFKCESCGVDMSFQGYEEGTPTCLDCHMKGTASSQ